MKIEDQVYARLGRLKSQMSRDEAVSLLLVNGWAQKDIEDYVDGALARLAGERKKKDGRRSPTRNPKLIKRRLSLAKAKVAELEKLLAEVEAGQ